MMADPLNYPRLRAPIDIRLERIEEQEVLVISCPLGIAERPLILISAVAPLLSCFEGRLSVREITEKFAPFGVREDQIIELINLLDSHLFMTSPRFFAAQKQAQEDFHNSPVRKSAIGGGGGEALAAELDAKIGKCLAECEKHECPPGDLIGLVSPHIDYHRGSKSYSAAYSSLSGTENSLYIMLGTGHQYSRHLFHLTLKDFETPLGIVRSDQAFVKDLAARYGWERSFADEMLHKREHSLEIQLPFLQKRESAPCIVPILVGSFHQMLLVEQNPSQFDVYEAFLSALAECTREAARSGRQVRVIAAVDFAHVGSHFGDPVRMTPEFLQSISARDRQLICCIAGQDKEALFSHMVEDQDARRVCGFPSLYTFIDLFDRLGVKYQSALFSYEQAVDWENDRCVTFAAMGCFSPHA